MSRRPIVFLFILSLTVTTLGADVSWPGWLGPNRDGWVPHFDPPAKWPKKLKKGWTAKVGDGYGTTAVDGNRLYVHARQKGDEVVWCLDLKNGKPKWRNRYAEPFKEGGGGEPHGKGPKANPTLAYGRLFTLSITGILTAWDADTGAMLWRVDHRAKFGKRPHPYWGACTSPLVVDNRVYLHFGDDEKGFLSAMDVETGKEIWRNGKDGAAYSSPLYAEIEGVRQIVEWNHEDLLGVELETGRTLWRYHLPHRGTNQNMPTPTIHNGHILVGGEKRGIRSIHPHLKNNEWTVSEKWHQTRAALDMSSAVINDNRLYGFSHYGLGELFCIDTTNGKILWKGPGRTGDNVTFLSVPGHVLALIDDGELQVLKADGTETRIVTRYKVADNPTWAAPVLLKDKLLIKDRDSLTLWQLSDTKQNYSDLSKDQRQ